MNLLPSTQILSDGQLLCADLEPAFPVDFGHTRVDALQVIWSSLCRATGWL